MKGLMKGFVRRLQDGSCVLKSDIPIPSRRSVEVLVKNRFAGLNFVDVYYRDGLYPCPDLAVLGTEGAGVVCDCDEELKSEWLNKRVVFLQLGSFAEYTAVPVSKLIPVPDSLSYQSALAGTTMGITAHYLCKSTAQLNSSSHVLVHAAGSGTGRLVAQVAAHVLGANVVGTSSSKKLHNVPLPKDKVFDYSIVNKNDLVAKLRALTPKGRGFDVVFDGVGKDTAQLSLDSCAPRGLVAFFGNASGPVPPIDPLQLAAKGSIFVTRPRLIDHVTTHTELLSRASDAFDWMKSGRISAPLDREFVSLESVEEALKHVKAGTAQGKMVVRIHMQASM